MFTMTEIEREVLNLNNKEYRDYLSKEFAKKFPPSLLREHLKPSRNEVTAQANFRITYFRLCQLINSNNSDEVGNLYETIEHAVDDMDALVDEYEAMEERKANRKVPMRKNPYYSKAVREYLVNTKCNLLWASDYEKAQIVLRASLCENFGLLSNAEECIKSYKARCKDYYQLTDKERFFEVHDELILARKRLKGFQKTQRKLKLQLKNLNKGLYNDF